jgi:hypothetical protein
MRAWSCGLISTEMVEYAETNQADQARHRELKRRKTQPNRLWVAVRMVPIKSLVSRPEVATLIPRSRTLSGVRQTASDRQRFVCRASRHGLSRLVNGRSVGVRAVLAAASLLFAAAGCDRSEARSHALFSTPIPWGESTSVDPVGQLWAAAGVPLCTRGSVPVTLTSIEPVKVSGQIRLERILVKRAQTGERAYYHGVPPGSHSVAGFVIPSPSPCAWRSPTDPFYEVIILARRTGPRGGSVSGLQVRYRAGQARGVYTIPFTDVRCGERGPPEHC